MIVLFFRSNRRGALFWNIHLWDYEGFRVGKGIDCFQCHCGEFYLVNILMFFDGTGGFPVDLRRGLQVITKVSFSFNYNLVSVIIVIWMKTVVMKIG